MTDSELASKMQGIARCLSYNSSNIHEQQAKHILLEASARLDKYCVRIHKKNDGYLIINARGKSRFLTVKELFLYKIFNVVPKEV